MPFRLQYAKCLVCNPALGTCVLSKARHLFTSNLQLICIEAQKKKSFVDVSIKVLNHAAPHSLDVFFHFILFYHASTYNSFS